MESAPEHPAFPPKLHASVVACWRSLIARLLDDDVAPDAIGWVEPSEPIVFPSGLPAAPTSPDINAPPPWTTGLAPIQPAFASTRHIQSLEQRLTTLQNHYQTMRSFIDQLHVTRAGERAKQAAVALHCLAALDDLVVDGPDAATRRQQSASLSMPGRD